VAALADAPRTGRPVQADAAYLAAMETALETPPAPLGLAFDVWTSDRLAAYFRAADRGASLAGLAAGPVGRARLEMWATQAHPHAPARPRRRGTYMASW
jgi:hypothetical protein